MYGLMYLNTYAFDHLYWSETRAYMALIMGSTMAIVMMAFMLGMYDSKADQCAIFADAGLIFAGSLYMVRSQAQCRSGRLDESDDPASFHCHTDKRAGGTDRPAGARLG